MMYIETQCDRELSPGDAVILKHDQALPQPRVGIVLEPPNMLGTMICVLWTNEWGAPYTSMHMKRTLSSVYCIPVP